MLDRLAWMGPRVCWLSMGFLCEAVVHAPMLGQASPRVCIPPPGSAPSHQTWMCATQLLLLPTFPSLLYLPCFSSSTPRKPCACWACGSSPPAWSRNPALSCWPACTLASRRDPSPCCCRPRCLKCCAVERPGNRCGVERGGARCVGRVVRTGRGGEGGKGKARVALGGLAGVGGGGGGLS